MSVAFFPNQPNVIFRLIRYPRQFQDTRGLPQLTGADPPCIANEVKFLKSFVSEATDQYSSVNYVVDNSNWALFVCPLPAVRPKQLRHKLLANLVDLRTAGANKMLRGDFQSAQVLPPGPVHLLLVRQ